jgi:hypothetical protein
MFEGIGPLELCVLLVAGGYLFYTFFLQGSGTSTPSLPNTNGLVDAFNKLKDTINSYVGNATTTVTHTTQVTNISEIVGEWESLRTTAENAGLKDAVDQLDEMWKLLNPHIKKG